MQQTRSSVTKLTREIKLSRQDLIALLHHEDIPINADIFITVPGGGDWSGMDVDISEKTPVIVRWVTTTETNE